MEEHRQRIENEFNHGVDVGRLILHHVSEGDSLVDFSRFYLVPVAELEAFCIKKRLCRKLAQAAGVNEVTARWRMRRGTLLRRALRPALNTSQQRRFASIARHHGRQRAQEVVIDNSRSRMRLHRRQEAEPGIGRHTVMREELDGTHAAKMKAAAARREHWRHKE
jgi:hypothetical protein